MKDAMEGFLVILGAIVLLSFLVGAVKGFFA